MMSEYETFFADVRDRGDGKGKEITVESKLSEYMGLEVGDRVKVMIRKLIKIPGEKELVKDNKDTESKDN